MTKHEVELPQALQRLRSSSKALAAHVGMAAGEIEMTCAPEGVKAFDHSPSRGAEAELALRKVSNYLEEIEHARATVERLLLDPHAPWS